MNNQEFFDKTMEHLRKQGVPSARGASCLYRGPEGTRCAIGFHIPDDMYNLRMEGVGVSNLLQNYPELRSLFESVTPGLLSEMQTLHDVWLEPDVKHMGGRAKAIASEYVLTYKEAS